MHANFDFLSSSYSSVHGGLLYMREGGTFAIPEDRWALEWRFLFRATLAFLPKRMSFSSAIVRQNKRRLSQFVVSTAAQFDFFDEMILEVKNKCCLLNVISKRHLIKHIQGSAERFNSEPLHVTISTINPIHRVIKKPAVVKKFQIS